MTTIIAPREHDLGDGFRVRRAVPTLQARSVGPFVFVDHMGPVVFEAGRGLDVRPHPHIGLATVTFLWDGAIRHRAGSLAHGMQTWVALPRAHEETDPAFHHHPAASLPQQHRDGAWLRVIAGRAYGEESPVQVFADTLNVAIDLDADAELVLDHGHVERALYILEGDAQLDDVDIPARHLVIPDPGTRPRLRARTPLKAMLLGGEPLDGHRHLWWNFVSSSKERIEQARQDWQQGRFGHIEGDDEFIPLPQR